eukprot:TRINITY_DN38485_c0_g1_i1.p1 TRINITY_DN38485_c0_g1~~TRINITY_DN38485_c0_g1_i1.p1  ORF type:complete len:204 (+),score=25.52 TRINITY_DN38485_c0_g1_i1:145-756(+)
MLIGLLGMLTSAASRALSDTLTFGITLAVGTNVLQYVHSRTVTNRRDVTPAACKWGPFCLITLASVASMVDITRQIVIDSSTFALVVADGSKAAFDFDRCTYVATASALTSSADASCPSEPMIISYHGAFSSATIVWLKSSTVRKVCLNLGRAALAVTILGFVWLSGIVQWVNHKWNTFRKHDSKESLLQAEECLEYESASIK